MGVALSVRLDKLDSLKSSTCSVQYLTSSKKNKQLTKLTTEIVLSGSKIQRNSQMPGIRKHSKC